MPLPNDHEIDPRRRWLVIGSVAFIILAAIVLLLVYRQKPGPSDQYTDPLSHQTVSSPAGKTPDKFGAGDKQPLYLGFNKLLDHGMTYAQLTKLETLFFQYSQSVKPAVNRISVDVDHITLDHNASDPNSNFILSFNVGTDQNQLYHARVEYIGLSEVRLNLIDPATNKIIFNQASTDSKAPD